jgi:hypothetical protein
MGIVLFSEDKERLKTFYEALGLVFEEDQHGSVLKHFTAPLGGGAVLEIYSLDAS